VRTREWLIENAKTNVEIDLFIRAGGNLLECSEKYTANDTVTLLSGKIRKGSLGLENSNYEAVHTFKMQIPEVAMRAICHRIHKAKSKAGRIKK